MADPAFSLVPPKIGSERSFGVLFAILFAVLAAWGSWRGRPWWLLALLPALLLALAAWRAPGRLGVLNRLWFRFGLLLGGIINPLLMGVLFFAVLTPMALLRRRRSREELGLRFDPAAVSYWKLRDPPGPDPQTLERQF